MRNRNEHVTMGSKESSRLVGAPQRRQIRFGTGKSDEKEKKGQISKACTDNL